MALTKVSDEVQAINHHALLGLSDDDHLQYLYLSGRAGGQTGIGGAATTENLIFRSNSVQDGKILLGDSPTSTEAVAIHGTETTATLASVSLACRLSIHDNTIGYPLLRLNRASTIDQIGRSITSTRSRGSIGAETAVQDDDWTMWIDALGYDGSNYERSVSIIAEIDDPTPSGTSMGGALWIATTPVGGVTPQQRFRISSAGRVYVYGSALSVNSIDYVWPASQAANRVLKTDGSSNLSWGQVAFSELSGTLAHTSLSSLTITTSGHTMNTARVLGRTTAAAGAIEELTMTGSGTVVAMQTSPVFLTQITTPKVYGKTTSGAGAEDLDLYANDYSGFWSGTGRIHFHKPLNINVAQTGLASSYYITNERVGTLVPAASQTIASPYFRDLAQINVVVARVLVSNATFWSATATEFTAALTETAGFNVDTSFLAAPVYAASNASGTVALGWVAGNTSSPAAQANGAGSLTISRMFAYEANAYGTILANQMVGANLTITNGGGLWIRDIKKGAGTLTNNIGLDIDALSTGGTTNIAIRMNQASGATGSWNLYGVGTADSSLSGRLSVGAGSILTPNTDMDIDGDLAIRVAGVSCVNGNNNDLAIGARSYVRITGPTAAFTINGFANGYDGKILVVYNTTTQNMSFAHDNAGSTAANRIYTNTGATVSTTGTGSATFIYDSTSSRWIITGLTV